MEKINVYSMPWVWPIIICCFNAWKWCGYNSIIYIAAITGIDGECYEAAQIDGANIFSAYLVHYAALYQAYGNYHASSAGGQNPARRF